MKIIAIVSGGMDSVTMLHKLVKAGYKFPDNEVKAISFNYGQRHSKELELAAYNCKLLGVDHKIIDMQFMKELVSNSALTGDIEVPQGHYEDENMKLTVVPNRNMIMASIAIGYAVNEEYDAIAMGVHAGDHAIYPDCRPEFIQVMRRVAAIANYRPINVIAPYLFDTKVEIVADGLKLGVDYSKTWTCYDPQGENIQWRPDLKHFTLDWLVGFFEGEGCFSERPDGASFSIAQADKDILEKIKETMGFGSVCKTRSAGDGITKQDAWQYSIAGGNAMRKLAMLFDGKLKTEKKKEQFERITSKYNLLDRRDARACGKCGSCQERLEAFTKNGVKDPLLYENNGETEA